MKNVIQLILLCCFLMGCSSTESMQSQKSPQSDIQTSTTEPSVEAIDRRVIGTGLEPWTYKSDFSDRTLGAWASYPFWQDIAYDPNFRTNEIVPGDPNVSIVQRVTPYTNVDNYAGAQKRMDMYLVPGASVSFRYYLKTSDVAKSYTVRFAAGEYGKLDVTIRAPETNRWVWVTVSYDDFLRENPAIAGQDRIHVYALAFLAKFPMADPDMPLYLGLDDIVFRSARAVTFQFAEPAVHKLPEFEPYIPHSHYHRNDTFNLRGSWPLDADRVTVEIANYTDASETIYEGQLRQRGENWELNPLRLSFAEGLYLGILRAYSGGQELTSTQFTIHIAPSDLAGRHPRLMFGAEDINRLKQRFQEPRFQGVFEGIAENAARERERIPVESLIYDLDQFPDEDWLPTWSAWGSRIYHTGNAVRNNSRAYVFHDDVEAGEYVRDVLVTLSEWPDWTHPWQTKRGRYNEHRTGSWSHRIAEAYDMVYDIMTEDERTKVRAAIMRNIVKGAHRTYVYNDNITAATSNWLAMITGGSLMSMAAMFQDGPDTENLEPYFTGALMKFYRFINVVTDSNDGSWGEGFGYNSYSFSNMSFSVPSLKNVYNIDVTEPLIGTYKEFIWGGVIKDRIWFEYGDSRPTINSAANWAFLLEMQQEPMLNWWYNYLKYGEDYGSTPGSDYFSPFDAELYGRESYGDVIHQTGGYDIENPFEMNPNKLFRDVGTTVFKSGWERDDFIFNMRTGPFYNHQHHEQGTFWLADRGEVFVLGNRPLSNTTYYDDPLYQPWYTQAVGASTVLIDHNHQSQRVGDDMHFAPGFDDHAFIDHYLDSEVAGYSTGDIGRLYWGKVESLRRNVLYLKPNAVLMLDTAVSPENDRDVTLLYQVERYEDINAGQRHSTITRGDVTMNILHLSPGSVEAKAVKTPHYLFTLQRQRPLVQEGMLTVTATAKHTDGYPLVIGNLFTSSAAGQQPDVTTRQGSGYVAGEVNGKPFVFNTRPGWLYSADDVTTDALAYTWESGTIFVAETTDFRKGGDRLVRSDMPVTVEISGNSYSYYHSEEGVIEVAASSTPSTVTVNGERVQDYQYDRRSGLVSVQVPAGEGVISVD